MSSTIGFKRKCSHASVVSEKAIQDAAAARIQIPLGPPFGKGGSQFHSSILPAANPALRNFTMDYPSLKKRSQGRFRISTAYS